ncbi:hypothetical protein PQX77_002715, partial [Marasmius sp. AFHP31]
TRGTRRPVRPRRTLRGGRVSLPVVLPVQDHHQSISTVFTTGMCLLAVPLGKPREISIMGSVYQ